MNLFQRIACLIFPGDGNARLPAEEFDPLQSLGFTEQFLVTRRARYLPEDEHFAIESIGCGVIFLMAFWSGPARAAFAELKRVLAEIDPKGRLELVVIDIDGCTRLCHHAEFGVNLIGGFGEVAWVKDGRVLRTTGRGFHPECFPSNTRALLNQCITEWEH